MLAFHPLDEHAAAPARLIELLQACKEVLLDRGMASMEEYGDMLKWGLPKEDGVCRNIHVFHPDWCSFSDQFFGTIHYHGGWIKGTILAGAMDHYTYEAKADPAGDRFHDGQAYTLARHTRVQREGTAYTLPARVPHWLKPHQLTLTYFEEEDGDMGDLVNPASTQTDDHTWDQPRADALLPELLRLIDARIEALTVTA